MPTAQVTYEAVIGLEVHCQLRTATKIFSPDPTAFGAAPNVHVDPVSLGHPGTLPVLNAQVVDFAIRLGLALDCTIAPVSVLARKQYFYPDLPKGYQISQYKTPICGPGKLRLPQADLETDADRIIEITRIHLEEDAGKSLHDQDPWHTLLDFNRCGTPLVEIVSAPDLRTPREAYVYMQQLQHLVRYLGISDGNMEEGSLRCDANVSVRPVGTVALGAKAEVKNMNSFRHVEQAIAYEVARQTALIQAGQRVVQETRLWDAERGETRPMRSKEDAHDYRYFPDPDLVPIVVTAEKLAAARDQLPELPWMRKARFTAVLGLPPYDAAILLEDRALADYFEATTEALAAQLPAARRAEAPKAVSNVVMTEVLRVLKQEEASLETFPITPDRLAALLVLRLSDQINSTSVQVIFAQMLTDASMPEAIAQAHNLLQVSDTAALIPVIEQVLASAPDKVAQYRSGKKGLIGFFIGQAMRTFNGSPDPKRVRELLLARLEEV